MRTYRLIAFALSLLVLTMALGACNPVEGEGVQAAADELVKEIPLPVDDAAQADTTYVGLTENGIGVGVVINDNAAVAYICDGRELGHWLKGKADDGRIDLKHDAGTKLEAQLSGDIVTGTVTLSNGEEMAFNAERTVDGISGLFRTTELKDGFVYGWVVVVDEEGFASVRGVGGNAKTKAVDGGVSVDVMDPSTDFGTPGEDGAPPDDVVETSGSTGNPALDQNLSCTQIKATYDALIFAADHATNKAVRKAYLLEAFHYLEAGGLKGCPV